MTSRRKFLKVIGGGTILAAASAVGYVNTRTPHAALAPWDIAPYKDPRKSALAHAILAPNPHNRQPWLIELAGETDLLIHRDTTRELPETDPFHRQLFIGLGCFLEAMVLAAGANGYSVDLTQLPEGDDGPVAFASFSKGGSVDPLAKQIPNRHSNKEPYLDQLLTQAQITTLSEFATLYSDPADVEELRALTIRAFDIEAYTPRTLKESIDLMRVGKSEINANPDGIEIRSPFLEALRKTGQLPNEVIADTEHPGFKSQHKSYLAMLNATWHYGAITTPTNTRLDQLDAGRQYMRCNLKTTEMDIGIHPVSQALQEYPEMSDEYALAHERLAPNGHTVQMLFRLGNGPTPVKTPRWPLETRIMNGA